jgi:FkbM family methyltransferase
MRLLPYDPYQSLTRVFETREELVVVDVGAHEGSIARRIVELFPQATVYAFEPSPSVLPALRRAADADARIRVVPVACGSADGVTKFNVTSEAWCSSVLPPSELGKRYYPTWLDVQRVVEVPIRTLDSWARENTISRVDVMKVDAQGYDLEVLRGARDLLTSGVRAVNCEFQFVAEYESCSTFSQIDRFLSDCGFALHQVHELSTRGNEEQTSYGDGLWLHAETLAKLRRRTDLPDISPGGRVRRAIGEVPQSGTIGIFGAGRHTRQAAGMLADVWDRVAVIIDDDPKLRGAEIEGKPIISVRDALVENLGAVILSSDTYEPALWRASTPLRAAGIRVVPLYANYDV